jgi:hypothetical protein
MLNGHGKRFEVKGKGLLGGEFIVNQTYNDVTTKQKKNVVGQEQMDAEER